MAGSTEVANRRAVVDGAEPALRPLTVPAFAPYERRYGLPATRDEMAALFSPPMTTSTRRFNCRPPESVLPATGNSFPYPWVAIRLASMPRACSADCTALARR